MWEWEWVGWGVWIVDVGYGKWVWIDVGGIVGTAGPWPMDYGLWTMNDRERSFFLLSSR